MTIGNSEFLGYIEDDPSYGELRTRRLRNLPTCFENEKYKNKYLEYTYDFGDSWEHAILLFGRLKKLPRRIMCFALLERVHLLQRIVEEKRDGNILKDVVKRYQRKGKLNEEDKHLIQWFKDRNGDCEVWDWDSHAVNQKLSAVRG